MSGPAVLAQRSPPPIESRRPFSTTSLLPSAKKREDGNGWRRRRSAGTTRRRPPAVLGRYNLDNVMVCKVQITHTHDVLTLLKAGQITPGYADSYSVSTTHIYLIVSDICTVLYLSLARNYEQWRHQL